jgi:uncharacterized protein
MKSNSQFMKQTALALSLLFCISTQAQSQTTPKQEKIKYLFSLMHQDSLINKTFAAMSSSLATQMANTFKDTLFTNAGIDYSDKMSQIMQKSMDASKETAKRLINEDMVDIYDKYFTIEDIDSFIDFYKSKAGQKMIDRLPDITKDIMTAMATKYQPAMQQSIMSVVEEMLKDKPAQ